MDEALFTLSMPKNEPVLDYLPGSKERAELKTALEEQFHKELEIPLIIGGKEVRTGDLGTCALPHDHAHQAHRKLRHAAGNFYVNDKPTGAVVGMQPFGGSRASGTNDKAGSMLNLLRWVTPRTIKETFVPPTEHTYPYMKEE